MKSASSSSSNSGCAAIPPRTRLKTNSRKSTTAASPTPTSASPPAFPVGLPTGNAGGEALVGVGDAAVVLFLEFVFNRVRGGIAAQPELLDELLALFIIGQAQKGAALFVGEDVTDFFVQPLFVLGIEFLQQALFALLALFIGLLPGMSILFPWCVLRPGGNWQDPDTRQDTENKDTTPAFHKDTSTPQRRRNCILWPAARQSKNPHGAYPPGTGLVRHENVQRRNGLPGNWVPRTICDSGWLPFWQGKNYNRGGSGSCARSFRRIAGGTPAGAPVSSARLATDHSGLMENFFRLKRIKKRATKAGAAEAREKESYHEDVA